MASLARDRNGDASTARNADSPAAMPLQGWKQVAIQAWKQSLEGNVALVAAGVAFYAFLALAVALFGARNAAGSLTTALNGPAVSL